MSNRPIAYSTAGPMPTRPAAPAPVEGGRRPPTTPRRDLPAAFSWLSATATDTPARPRGNTVQPTRLVATGDATMTITGQRVDASAARVRDLPHEDRQQAIIWRAELRGATHTLQSAPAEINPSLGNAWVLDVGSTTLLPPPPVPASQRVPGAPVRPRSAVVWIIARRPYTVGGPVLWNVRAKPASREILVPGDPPTTETLDYLEPETGAPPAEPSGQWDTLRLTWFESVERWSAEVQVGNLAEQDGVEPQPPEEEQPEDDQGDPDPEGEGEGYTGDGDPYDPADVAQPPGAGDPDDEFVDDDGNRRLRSQGRLFLLTSTSLYLLSGDGGRTWSRGTGPWGAGAAASVLGGVVHVIDGTGQLWISSNGATSWTRAPRGVQLAQTAAGGGNQLAVGRAGRVAIDGGAAREGDTPLGDRSLTSLAYRRPTGGGADAWEIADEKRGSLDGALRGVPVNRIEDTSTGTQYWVGPRAANPTIAAGPYRIIFDRTTWLDGGGNVWSPIWPNQFLTDSIAWPGGSALDYAQAVIDALNPQARQRLTGPYLPLPVDFSASVEWVEYPDNTKRARLTILWQPRPPAAGEFPVEFRPHDRLRLDGAFGFEAVSGSGADADWDATSSTVRYEGNLGAATAEAAPNSDSFALLKIEALGGDIDAIAMGGVLNGTIKITAIHNTTLGWTPAGPRPPAEDTTRSIIEVEVVIFSVGTWRGGVGGEGLPEDERPIRNERANGSISVSLAYVSGSGGVPEAADVSLSVTIPAGWRLPIDFQSIPGARPWLGMTSEGLGSSIPVNLVYRAARDGAWAIAASDRQASLAVVSGADISFSPMPPLEPGTDTVISTRTDIVSVGAGGASAYFANQVAGGNWIFNPDVTTSGPFSVAAPITWGAGRDRVLAISRNGGPNIFTIDGPGTGFSTALGGALASRRATSLNRRAGRWWAVDGGTNRLYWSNNGEDWRVLPPLGTDVQAVEVEGE